MPRVKLKFGGVNNVLDPMELGAVESARAPELKELVSGINVDISDRETIRRRQGYTRPTAGAHHSAWSNAAKNKAYCVANGVLLRINADYTTTALATLSNNARMSFCEVNDSIVCTNGADYIVLYQDAVSAPAATDKIGRIPTRPGRHVCFHNGRVYVGTDWGLYFTDPYDVDYMDEGHCRIPLGEPVTMLAGNDAGIWVGTPTKTILLLGDDITEAVYKERAGYGVIPNAFAVCEGAKLGSRYGQGKVVAFASNRGLCFGLPSGELLNISLDKFSYAPGTSGAVLMREYDGMVHLIAAIENPGTPYNKDGGVVTPDQYTLN